MNYGEVLTRAWKIVWKFKVLWIFGILSSCGRGGGNSGSGWRTSANELPPQVQQTIAQSDRFLNDYWWVIALFILLIFVIIVLFVFLNTIGKIALIKGTVKAEEGAERLGFSELFNLSLPYFWRVFGLSMLLFAAFLIIFLLIGAVVGVLAVFTLGIALICLVPLCCLFAPLMWAIGVVIEQAYIAIVVEDRGVFDGLGRGWEVVKTHWEPMVVMAVILIFGAGIIGFVLAIPFFLVVFPAIFALALGQGRGSMAVFVTAGICILAYLPILIVLGGILTAYVESAWTLTFLRLTGRGPNPEAAPVEPEATLPPLQSVNA
jgi:hypothetical protein